MIRAELADRLRRGGDRCEDCGDRLGAIRWRHWHMTIRRPWTWLLPEIERTCYDCGIDREIEQHAEEVEQ